MKTLSVTTLLLILIGLSTRINAAQTFKNFEKMTYPFQLPALPYALDALEPIMNKETLEYHYGKHMAAYVNNLNNLIKDTPMEKLSLVEIIQKSEGGIFNNAAQVWNHKFFFDQFSPEAKLAPSGKLNEAIVASFGSLDAFKTQFVKAATTLFGSGWAWLIVGDNGKLEIVQGSNAQTPIKEGKKVLMTIDVWEHAYYIEYRNRRPDYLNSIWDIIDWKVIESRF